MTIKSLDPATSFLIFQITKISKNSHLLAWMSLRIRQSPSFHLQHLLPWPPDGQSQSHQEATIISTTDNQYATSTSSMVYNFQFNCLKTTYLRIYKELFFTSFITDVRPLLSFPDLFKLRPAHSTRGLQHRGEIIWPKHKQSEDPDLTNGYSTFRSLTSPQFETISFGDSRRRKPSENRLYLLSDL